ncbi:MAG: hypothetical protein ABWY08_14595 [Comamonas sp.]
MNARNLTIAFALVAPCCVLAQSSEIKTISAECTTEPTGISGERYNCDSDVSVLRAPEGFVFAVDTASASETSGAGSEHSCNLGWDDWVEVIPGTQITQPRKMTLSAHARGPSGHLAGRGWAKCKYTVMLSRYLR